MKRPDGWDDLYLKAYREEHTGYGSPERAMFEAGADAYRESLMKEGVSVEVDKSGSIAHFHYRGSDKGMVGYDMAENLSAKSKGWLVFIKEEVE